MVDREPITRMGSVASHFGSNSMKAICAILLFTFTAHAQTLPRAILYGGTAFDVGSTWNGVHHGLRESNPIVGQHPARQVGVVVGSVIAIDWLAAVLERDGHGRQGKWLRAAVGVGHVVVGIWNLRVK